MQLTSEHRVKLRISESVSLTENHRELLESLLDPLRSAATAMPISARRGAALPTVHVGRHSQRDATYRNAAPRVPPRGERRSDPAPRAARPLPQRSERCPRRGKRRMCNAAVLNGGKGGSGAGSGTAPRTAPACPPGALPSGRGRAPERLRGYAVTARGGAGGGTHRAAGTGPGTAPTAPSPGGCGAVPRPVRVGAGRRAAAAGGRAAARGWREAGGAAEARGCAAASGSCPPGSRAAWPRGAARRKRRGGGRPAAARCRAAPAPSCRRADGDRRPPRAAAGDGMRSGRERRWLRPLGAAPGTASPPSASAPAHPRAARRAASPWSRCPRPGVSSAG